MRNRSGLGYLIGGGVLVAVLAWKAMHNAPAPTPGVPPGAAPGQTDGAPTPSAGPDASMAPPNLVLITMEATRSDHLGCYEDTAAQTPALDQLAHEGAIFEQAIAAAPLTLPSLASILTGDYPPRHGLRDNGGFTLDDARLTLAEHLKAQGFKTAASVGSRLLAKDAGLKQGFDSYAQPNAGSRGAVFVVNDAIEAVDRVKGTPFFLWLQFDDPNAPYLPPPGLRAKFAGRLYDGDIAWMDLEIKRFLDHLRRSGLLDNTIVVATAAEGESLGEHGEETHGLLVYDTTIRVPLLVRYPAKIEAGTRSKGLVSLIDLAPTVLEVMGLPPMAGVQGKSFAATLAGKDAPERPPVYVESLFGARAFGWVPLHAIRTASFKFIDAPEPEVYDMHRDPSETINRAARDATAVSALRSGLENLMRAIGVDAGEAIPATGGRDPKKMIAVANLYLKAQVAIEEGRADQATLALTQALAKDPGNVAAKSLLAALRGEAVAPSGATSNSFAAQWNLGNALYVQGKLPEAAKAFSNALTINPKSAETHYALGNVLADQGDAPGAERELRAAVAGDPKMADGWNKLGILLDKAKRRPEALEAFTHALDAAPDHPDALFNRAKVELLEDYLVDARRDLDRLLAKHDDYAAARYLEAHLCMAEKNTPGAKDALGMPVVIEIVMLSVAAIMLLLTKVNVDDVPKTATLRAGVVAVIGIFGLAWLGDSFIAAHKDVIVPAIGDMTKAAPWTFALGLFFASVLLYSQAATTRALMPLGMALGIPPQFLIAMFPSVNGYFFIPTYGSLIAAINFDLSGTTKIGKYILNHSFMIPGLVATFAAVFTGLLLAKLMF
jgi:arylsulfatase A-like enzyme/Tfp pilus assembly protein PilF